MTKMYNIPMEDANTLSLIADLAHTDDKAMTLVMALENAKDWGEEDMIICSMTSYLKDRKKDMH